MILSSSLCLGLFSTPIAIVHSNGRPRSLCFGQICFPAINEAKKTTTKFVTLTASTLSNGHPDNTPQRDRQRNVKGESV